MRLYNDYSSYLKAKYGSRVYRIAIDANFPCPNRCLYCNENGSRAAYVDPKNSVEKQLSSRIEYLKKSKCASKFIAYFQAFSNTNSSNTHLKETYDRILRFNEIVGLSIGTRPDCIDASKLELISLYADKYEVWVEYGLQSIHDITLEKIKRGHDFNDFLDAYYRTKKFPISICAHVIIGLPGETREMMLETARKLTELKVDAVKIHLLHVLRGSELETLYRDDKIKILDQDEYAGLACDFLENLSENIIIQRLTGEGKRGEHIAPLWALDKLGTIQKIGKMLEKRGTRQGSSFAKASEDRSKCAFRP